MVEYKKVLEIYKVLIIKLNRNIKTNGKRNEKSFKFPNLLTVKVIPIAIFTTES